MAQNDGGQAAMQRRKTKLGDNIEFDASDYAKIIGDDKSFHTDSEDEDVAPKPMSSAKAEKRESLRNQVS